MSDWARLTASVLGRKDLCRLSRPVPSCGTMAGNARAIARVLP